MNEIKFLVSETLLNQVKIGKISSLFSVLNNRNYPDQKIIQGLILFNEMLLENETNGFDFVQIKIQGMSVINKDNYKHFETMIDSDRSEEMMKKLESLNDNEILIIILFQYTPKEEHVKLHMKGILKETFKDN